MSLADDGRCEPTVVMKNNYTHYELLLLLL